MRTTKDDRDAAFAKMPGQFVRTDRSTGYDCQSDEVSIQIQRDIADSFINQLQFSMNFLGHERGKGRESERLITEGFAKNAAAVPIERTLRRDRSEERREGKEAQA